MTEFVKMLAFRGTQFAQPRGDALRLLPVFALSLRSSSRPAALSIDMTSQHRVDCSR